MSKILFLTRIMIYISVENESDKELTHVCNLSFRSGSCTYIALALNFFQNLSSQNLVRVISFHTPYAKVLHGRVFYVLRGGADGRSILTSCFTAFASLFVFYSVLAVVFLFRIFLFYTIYATQAQRNLLPSQHCLKHCNIYPTLSILKLLSFPNLQPFCRF